MCIDQAFLTTVFSMKQLIEKNKEPNGKFSIQKFIDEGIIEYSDNDKDTLYVRDTKRGDHVTKLGHFMPNVRNVIWAERTADKEAHSPAVTLGLKDVLEHPDCVCLLKDISDNPDLPHYVPDSYVKIPHGHIAIVSHVSITNEVGAIVVVPNLK